MWKEQRGNLRNGNSDDDRPGSGSIELVLESQVELPVSSLPEGYSNDEEIEKDNKHKVERILEDDLHPSLSSNLELSLFGILIDVPHTASADLLANVLQSVLEDGTCSLEDGASSFAVVGGIGVY